MLEAARNNGGFSTVQATSNLPTGGGVTSSKNKTKGVFATFDQSDPESEDEVSTGVHVAAGHSDWIKPGSHYKFPCPLQNHDHEIAACLEFLTLTPKDHWVKIPRGRICYKFLKPKGANSTCKTRPCTEEKTIPQVLLCAACTPWATAKGWASFSILMCRKQEHRKDRPKPAEARKFLEKYLGKSTLQFLIIILVMRLILITRYFLSLIYRFRLVLVPLPLTLSSALKLILPRLRLSLKYRSTRFILCSG